MKIWKHFCTITHHKYLVMKNCFKVGLYRQGLLHDMSKYSPAEFWVGCRYFQGNRSPNNAEREEKGYSSAWLHHKGRNKHHYEYWIDYGLEGEPMLTGMKMPKKYVVEMLMDRIAASKIYMKDKYTDTSPLEYRVENERLLEKEDKNMADLPKDPMILLSVVNTKLRDFYADLDTLCQEMQIEKKELTEKLASIDYEYDAELNQFV